MRKFLPFLIAFLFIFNGCSSKPRDFNVLVITIDTLRADHVSAINPESPVKTEAIDSIAKKGALFTRAFAHAPLTLPSHTSIFTGLTPIAHGIHDNSGFVLSDSYTTMAEFLKTFNYSTGAFVSAFPLDSRYGLYQGFDVYDDRYGTGKKFQFFFAERRAEKTLSLVEKWLDEQKGKWFLWIHLFDPHQPYNPPEPFNTRFKNDLYSGEIAYTDQQLSKFFAYLKKKGVMENTVIVITSDHGEALGEHGERTHGYFAYNSTLHVPLIIYYPGIKHIKSEKKVSHIDIFPTLCDILNIKKPEFLQGKSLLPEMKGKGKGDKVIYFEALSAYYNRGWAPLRGFIKGNIKFIDLPIKEVYDIDKDFNETKNLASGYDTIELEKQLKKIIDSYSKGFSPEGRKKVSAEEIKKLRSLGYVVGTATRKKVYSKADDLKVLLPYHLKLMDAIKLFSEGKVTDAIPLLENIIEQRPEFVQAYTTLATMYRAIGKFDEAEKVLRKGLKYNPENSSLLSTLGITLVEKQEPEKAIPILKEALKRDPNDVDAWNSLGIAYWRSGNYDEAMEAYRKALSLDSNDPLVYNNLGSLFLSMQIPEDAEKYFKKAIELDPSLASAYNGIGAAYEMRGNPREAVKWWERALEKDPNHYFALFNLGTTLYKLGEKSEARKYLKKYLKLYGKVISQVEKERIRFMLTH
ncbi:MAG: sulfatase-like hydrolase/transferase [Candidatus Aminicenantes bacterium]|nr:sulfatase-like hydrolase/transferase [Candidatus Aminicenantes bacterium]